MDSFEIDEEQVSREQFLESDIWIKPGQP
jgi:hypothetical protein